MNFETTPFYDPCSVHSRLVDNAGPHTPSFPMVLTYRLSSWKTTRSNSSVLSLIRLDMHPSIHTTQTPLLLLLHHQARAQFATLLTTSGRQPHDSVKSGVPDKQPSPQVGAEREARFSSAVRSTESSGLLRRPCTYMAMMMRQSWSGAHCHPHWKRCNYHARTALYASLP